MDDRIAYRTIVGWRLIHSYITVCVCVCVKRDFRQIFDLPRSSSRVLLLAGFRHALEPRQWNERGSPTTADDANNVNNELTVGTKVDDAFWRTTECGKKNIPWTWTFSAEQDFHSLLGGKIDGEKLMRNEGWRDTRGRKLDYWGIEEALLEGRRVPEEYLCLDGFSGFGVFVSAEFHSRRWMPAAS